MKRATWIRSASAITKMIDDSTNTSPTATVITAWARRKPRRMINPTSGSRPTARNAAIKTRIRADCASCRASAIRSADRRPRPTRKPRRNGESRDTGGPGRPSGSVMREPYGPRGRAAWTCWATCCDESMRVLLPQPADDVDLHEFYAADWMDAGGLRVDFVSSVDGAAQAKGRSAGLQTPGDNRVFAALRDLADVVLVGSGTALVERYRGIRLDEQRLAIRRAYGLGDTLPIAVISRSLRMDPSLPLFAQ